MNKKKHLLILIFIGLVSAFFLGTRPKFVVKKDEGQSVQQKPSSVSKAENSNEDNHTPHLSSNLIAKLQPLQKELKVSNEGSRWFVYEKIATLFQAESVFDSAGFYFEKIATNKPTKENWQLAGDNYFQAYNLALSPKNIEESVSKTRSCYNKVLTLDPNNLHAKTNLAMTFVQTDSPMKAISMLREVLDQEPNYVPAIMSLGGLSMQSNQYDKAAARFQNVLKIDPANVNAKIGLAYSLIELGKKQEAIGLFNQLLKTNIDKVMKDEIAKTLNSLK